MVKNSDASDDHSTEGLQLLIKVLLLRRKKGQVNEITDAPLISLPTRYKRNCVELCTRSFIKFFLLLFFARNEYRHVVTLSHEEKEEYQKFFVQSRKEFLEYLKTQKTKGKKKHVSKEVSPTGNMFLSLLRLRQVCCHPLLTLIKPKFVDAEAKALGSKDVEIEVGGLTDFISENSNETKKEQDSSTDIYSRDYESTKIKFIIEEVKKVVAKGEKAVVISQWTSMLELIAHHFDKKNIPYHTFDGKVSLEKRAIAVEDFNKNRKGKPVKLNLSFHILVFALIYILFCRVR